MAMTEFSHYSVLLGECIEGLDIKPDGIYVDGTAGGGGHSFEIAKRLTTGRLIAIDQDEDAIAAAGKRLSPFSDRVTLVRNNFSNLERICADLGIEKIDGFLIAPESDWRPRHPPFFCVFLHFFPTQTECGGRPPWCAVRPREQGSGR